MPLLNRRQVDANEYIERATKIAIAGVSEGLARRVGSLVGHDRWTDENGHWLRVRAELEVLPDVEIRYARVLLPAAGADMEAETEAILFSSGFEERLDTRLHRTASVDGVITL